MFLLLTTWFKSAISKITPYLVAIGGTIAAYLAVKNQGKNEQKSEDIKNATVQIQKADVVKEAVDALPSDAVSKQLHEFYRD